MAKKAETVFTGLEPYELAGVKVTGTSLGYSSCGTLLELEHQGKKFSGEMIRESLLLARDKAQVVRRFRKECSILKEMHHPNVIQFLGVHFMDNVKAPVLVTELLPTKLSSYIEQHDLLPLNITNCSILSDVIQGLHHLHTHTPQIIHCHLSSNTVLLTSNLKAKISDLSMARILDIAPLHMVTQTPGTLAFLAPELMKQNPTYSTSTDAFSYGIILIHLLSGRWPEPQVEPVIADGDNLVPVTEADRRKEYLTAIGEDHPLMDLIHQCIHNSPQKRPSTDQIQEVLKNMLWQFTSHEEKEDSESDRASLLGSMAPTWLPDSAVTACQQCGANFTTIRRRHHCRACGKIFCGDCSKYEAQLQYKQYKPERVCRECYKELSLRSISHPSNFTHDQHFGPFPQINVEVLPAAGALPRKGAKMAVTSVGGQQLSQEDESTRQDSEPSSLPTDAGSLLSEMNLSDHFKFEGTRTVL